MKIKGMKFIRKLLLIIICLLMTACSIGMDTKLELNDDQSGERIITISVGKDSAEEYGKEKLGKVENVIESYKPDLLDYKKEVDKEGTTKYIFTLAFSNLEDYREKIKTLINREPTIEVKEPNTVFSKGIAINEDFSSSDLTQWFKDGLEKEGLEDDITSHFSQETTVIYKGEEYTSGSIINVNEIESNPLDFIAINTTVTDDETYERTVEFVLPTETYQKNKKEIDKFFATLIPDGGTGKWVSQLVYPTEDEYLKLDNDKKDYCVSFTASDLAELMEKSNKVFNTDSAKIAFAESDSENENPYQLIKTWNESIDLSSFGSDSEARVRYYYSILTEGNAKFENEYGEQSDSWQLQAEDSILNVQAQMVQRYPVTDMTTSIQVDNENSITQTFDITYEGKLAEEGAQRTSNYLKNLFTDTDVKVNEKSESEKYTVEISFSGEMQETQRNIEMFLGESNSYFHYSILESNLFSQDVSFSYQANLYDLKQQLGYEGDIRLNFNPRSGDSISQLEFNDQYIENNDTSSFTSDNGYIMISYSASRTLWFRMLAGLIIFVVVLALLFIGSIFYAKRWAKNHDLDDLSLMGQLKAFYAAGIHQIKVLLGKGINELKHLDHFMVPEGADLEIFHYFYGKLHYLLISIIVFIITALYTLFILFAFKKATFAPMILGFIQFIIVYVYALIGATIQTNPLIEKKIDSLISDFSNSSLEMVLKDLDLDECDLIAIPVQLSGASSKFNELLNAKTEEQRKKVVNRLMKTGYRTIPRLKTGQDKKRRYTDIELMYLIMTEQQFLVQRIEYNVVTGKLGNKSLTEYHYQNLNGVYSGSENRVQNEKERKIYTYVCVEGFSGTKDTIWIEEGQKILSNEFIALQNIIRERKKMIEEENQDE